MAADHQLRGTKPLVGRQGCYSPDVKRGHHHLGQHSRNSILVQVLGHHTSDGTLNAEPANWVARASSAFARLRQLKVWSSKALSLSTKMQVFQSIVKPILLYGIEPELCLKNTSAIFLPPK